MKKITEIERRISICLLKKTFCKIIFNLQNKSYFFAFYGMKLECSGAKQHL